MKFSIVALLFLAGLNSYGQEITFSKDLKETALHLESKFKSPLFTATTCPTQIYSVTGILSKLTSNYFNRTEKIKGSNVLLPKGTTAQGALEGPDRDVFKILWDTRLVLQSRLREFVQSKSFATREDYLACADAVHAGVREVRSLEEFWQLNLALAQDSIEKGSLIFEKKWPLTAVNTQINKDWSFPDSLESGDIFISRGEFFAGGLIARIGQVATDFSHAGIIYRDEEGKLELYNDLNGTKVYWHATANDTVSIVDGTGAKVHMDHVRVRNVAPGEGIVGQIYVVESLISHGLQITPIEAFIADPKARMMMYKLQNLSKDPKFTPLREVSSKAAEILIQRAVKEKVCYNFSMRLDDNTCVFCTQAISTGFDLACKEPGFNCEPMGDYAAPNLPNFPMYYTKINVDKIDITKTLAMNTPLTFAPSDMEVDPRVIPMGQWHNLKDLINIRYHDISYTKLLQWMEIGGYETKKIPVLDLYSGILKPVVAATGKMPSNMPKEFITGTFFLGLLVKTPPIPGILIKQLQLAAINYPEIKVVADKLKDAIGFEPILTAFEKNNIKANKSYSTVGEMYAGLENLRVKDCKNWKAKKANLLPANKPIYFHDFLSSDANGGPSCSEKPFILTDRY